MSPTESSALEVAEWIRERCSAVRVEHGHNFDREETLFRILRREATWPHPEFSIVDAVFDDHPAPEICAILEAQQLVERSIKAPGFRFRLGREGLAPDMELLEHIS